MQQDKTFLGTEPVGRLLFQLAVPTVTAQLVNMLYNIVDRIYIGHMPGDGSLALTGVGVCMPLIMIVSAFAALVASGGAPRASIAMGRGDHAGAERLLGGCAALLLLLSLTLTAVLLLWGRDLLLLFGASENTVAYAADYMGVYAVGTVFVQLTLGLNAFVTAQGFARTGMLTVLIGALANIALDPLFIFALDMGVRGAALATVLSQALSCVWVTSFLCGKKTLLRLRRENLLSGLHLVPPCIALGSSSFVMQASESVISVCFNSSLLKYGGDLAVGAMTILTSVMQFALLPLTGLSQGAQPITSYNYGARNPDRVKKTIKLAMCYAEGIMLIGFCLFQFAPDKLLSFFAASDAMLAIGIPAMRTICFHFLLAGMSIILSSTFQALGNGMFSLIVSVCRQLVVLLPAAWLLSQTGNVNLVWWSFVIAELVSVTLSFVFFARLDKKIIEPMYNKAPAMQ